MEKEFLDTNDVTEWNKIVDRIRQIDSKTCKSIRKLTMGLRIIDAKEHRTFTDAMLVNHKAVMPLIFATYENHHTRELLFRGGDLYIADKTDDVYESVAMFKEQFPELTVERSEAIVCMWFRKILIPYIRGSCADKMEFYTTQLKRKDLGKCRREFVHRLARCGVCRPRV